MQIRKKLGVPFISVFDSELLLLLQCVTCPTDVLTVKKKKKDILNVSLKEIFLLSIGRIPMFSHCIYKEPISLINNYPDLQLRC